MDTLVAALAAVPAHEDPLNPVYEVLCQQQPLTLRALRQHTQLLHDRAGLAQDQTFSVQAVILSCQRISPTPLPSLPLGF